MGQDIQKVTQGCKTVNRFLPFICVSVHSFERRELENIDMQVMLVFLELLLVPDFANFPLHLLYILFFCFYYSTVCLPIKKEKRRRVQSVVLQQSSCQQFEF